MQTQRSADSGSARQPNPNRFVSSCLTAGGDRRNQHHFAIGRPATELMNFAIPLPVVPS